MRTLIVKYIKSDFEKVVCSWFEKNGCKVVGFDQLAKGKTGVKKRLSYINSARNGFNCDCEQIIVFDDYDFFIIYKMFGKKKICLWMWNKISNSRIELLKLKIAKLFGDIYSFDKGDSQKYGLKYNTQFYSLKYVDQSPKRDIYQKLFFIGKDKNRYRLIRKMAEYLDENKINYSFMVFPDKGGCYDRTDLISKVYMDYDDVCSMIRSSEAVLDIVQEGQEGLTLRAMEAVFFDKKIVTNNPKYLEYSFYSPDKVYIIHGENFDGLNEFLNNKIEVKYSNECKEYFDISSWIERFKIS